MERFKSKKRVKTHFVLYISATVKELFTPIMKVMQRGDDWHVLRSALKQTESVESSPSHEVKPLKDI